MSNWNLYGEKRRENFEEQLTPEALYQDLNLYQEQFGEKFGIHELLLLIDIRAKALIAEAINDAPEFLIDQIGKAYDDYSFYSKSIAGELEEIAETLYNTQRS